MDWKAFLKDVKSGRISEDSALTILRELPFASLGFATPDTHRSLRKGLPEVVFGEGKDPEHCALIVDRLLKSAPQVLVTRADEKQFSAVRDKGIPAVFHETARIIAAGKTRKPRRRPLVWVVSAGTSDLPVAEEAAVTAEALGLGIKRLYDVGVAGIHRLVPAIEDLRNAVAIIVVAGMEGALPSVVAGLVDVPVIGVPTSVGYGANFGGVTALLTMLNSCSNGLAVMNINNGFGAAVFAFLIARRIQAK